MKIETASNTKQTTATAQVGVSVKLRSSSLSAMDQSPFSAGAQLSKYLQKTPNYNTSVQLRDAE